MPLSFRRLRPALALVAAASVLVPLRLAAAAPAARAGDDAVVIAVIDSGISPYHWDFLAAKMPQALNKDRSDDLPLSQPPHTWLRGFPAPKSFGSYTGLKLTLDAKDDTAKIADLKAKDAKQWAKVKDSTPDAVNYYWFPGTKVIGGVSFGYTEQVTEAVDKATAPLPQVGYTYSSVYDTGHGLGTSSVSTGNIFGTCPECLVVHITAADTTATEQALAWAQSQPWIDVVSNSYGLQTVPTGAVRDGLYGGPVETQKLASERGQTIVFSAGNGIENGFAVPFSTLTSSVKGPDWVITVGATHPTNKAQYSGSGKPVDVAGVGSSYPSAYNASTVTGGSRFSGTSNAAPTVAGTYARGLYLARRTMAGPSRIQKDGVISVGTARCGRVRRTCEIGDGRLTAVELRHRLLKGAVSTGGGTTPAGVAPTARVADEHYAAEGHGTYYARLKQDDALWLAEFERFFAPVVGRGPEVARPADEDDWFRVDSWCRQHIFGAWSGGYWKDDQTTPRPLPHPGAPTRTALDAACRALIKLPGTPRP
ncbi:MAG TPA: S8/S53 family peptidase [Mycobacteriales bacterium]|nr:S8/S53 family peptidase [Mycobacteriales bacterium]